MKSAQPWFHGNEAEICAMWESGRMTQDEIAAIYNREDRPVSRQAVQVFLSTRAIRRLPSNKWSRQWNLYS